MNGWQVSVMYENAIANEWEQITAPDPFAEQMEKASFGMKEAVDHLSKAEDALADAIEELKDTPLEDQVASLLDSLEDVRVEISILAYRFKKGVRA